MHGCPVGQLSAYRLPITHSQQVPSAHFAPKPSRRNNLSLPVTPFLLNISHTAAQHALH